MRKNTFSSLSFLFVLRIIMNLFPYKYIRLVGSKSLNRGFVYVTIIPAC